MTRQNKESIFEDFPGYNRFDYPSNFRRVTSGFGGESILICGSKKTALYDTGMAYAHKGLIDNIEKALKDFGRDNLDMILLSHTHYDHIGALPYVIQRWPDVEVIASEKAKTVFARDGAKKTMKRLGEAARDGYTSSKEDILVDPLRVDKIVFDRDEISIGKERFVVLEAKGHTDCSLAYILEPVSIMFASESTGPLRSPNEVDTAFLKSYEQTMETAIKCKNYHPKQVIAPHYGIMPEYFTNEYFDLYMKTATDEKDFILSCRDKGLDKNGIYDEFEKMYWSEARKKAQPKAAFIENSVIIINTILEDYKNV